MDKRLAFDVGKIEIEPDIKTSEGIRGVGFAVMMYTGQAQENIAFFNGIRAAVIIVISAPGHDITDFIAILHVIADRVSAFTAQVADLI
jgi:hypothetical protein